MRSFGALPHIVIRSHAVECRLQLSDTKVQLDCRSCVNRPGSIALSVPGRGLEDRPTTRAPLLHAMHHRSVWDHILLYAEGRAFQAA